MNTNNLLTVEIHTGITCTEMCFATARWCKNKGLLRCAWLCKRCANECIKILTGFEITAAQYQKCIEACSACASACDVYDDTECKKCATICKEYAYECRRLLFKMQVFQPGSKLMMA